MTGLARLAACAVFGTFALFRPAGAADEVKGGEMVSLPGGFFKAGELMGPLRDTVTYSRVGPFLLDVTEVTVAAYGECVKAGRCKAAYPTVEWERIGRSDRAMWSAYCNRDRPDRAEHPVNCVEWDQARAYCAWAGKRLPTEEEWEWAARNGKAGTTYPWGDEPPVSQLCWNGEGNDLGKGKRASTCPVGSHAAADTKTGVKDLAGNVWEWTSSSTVVFADSRGRGGTPVKVARGGSWAENDPRNVSVPIRLLDLPSLRRSDLGFRCAKSP